MSMSEIALLFEPDGYILGGPRLMGRQAAGSGFLRALVAHAGGRRLWAYSPHRQSGETFIETARALDPACKTGWLAAHRLDRLAKIGMLYLPGPSLTAYAHARLRVAANAYSLVGITHTTATHAAMDAVCDLLSAPVFPWDALICTSSAVRETVQALLDGQADYLRWRLGAQNFTVPQLPVIPLGVHCEDFEFSAQDRRTARRDLGIADEEVVALFVGRLSFHAKAHPHAMYAALEQVAQRSGQKVVLLQCGWFANAAIERAFKSGASRFCPSVRTLWSDGRDREATRQAWAAGDVFISLSDNVQETFGLTPIEAMAAGLPAIVSDWDGYKDTVRDGIDGYRIPTRMPAAPLGRRFALRYETGAINYDEYCGVTCQSISVDHERLADCAYRLITEPALRAQLGREGKLRARQAFDWSVVIARYFELWQQLAEIRAPFAAAADRVAPQVAPARRDPFELFANYASTAISPQTRVTLAPTRQQWRELRQHWLFSYAEEELPAEETIASLLAAVEAADAPSIEAVARNTRIDLDTALLTLAWLAKSGFVRLTD